MATIEHVLPIAFRPLSGASEGMKRPGLQVTQYETGYRQSRDWFEYSMRAYSWNLVRFQAETTKQRVWEQFLEDIGVGSSVCWIREALEATHPKVPLCNVGDGSKRSFVLPFFGSSAPSDLAVMVGGVPTVDYSVHAKANLLSDSQASGTGGVTIGMSAFGTCAIESPANSFPTADGLYSWKVNPTGTVANYGIETDSAERVTASEGDRLSFLVAIYGSGNFTLTGTWYNIGGTSISTVTDNASSSYGGWTILQVSGTAPALTVEAGIRVECTDSSDLDFWADCFAIAPGDLERWFLPSEAPMVIDFDTAPGTNLRPVVKGTGTWMARTRLLSQGFSDWSRLKPGATEKVKLSLEEELES